MAKIHTLTISNFRGIKSFHQEFGHEDFVCIIGRGDSGKTTILEAISLVLSPQWNLSFCDTDFYNCDLTKQIIIEASLMDLPETLLQVNKFGHHIRFLDPRTSKISDEIDDDAIDILTIRLTVTKDLEPIWEVVNNRKEPIEIKSKDRASLNAFLISDYIDRHFSWSKGSPLFSLLKASAPEHGEINVIINELRFAKDAIDKSTGFEYLEETLKKVTDSANKLGLDIGSATTTIDARDLNIKDGKVCLHDEKIPFRLKGKGSKRLVSIAIQIELAKSGGILLVDEIEQGLEPDRVQHLANTLKNSNNGQIFITTHSRDVLVELEFNNLFKMKRSSTSLFTFPEDMQGCIRMNPEAFFAERVLVCEGPTEVGFCRELNYFRVENGKNNLTLLAIRLANGAGANQITYAENFQAGGYDVCMLCDADVDDVNLKKPSLKAKGIKIVDPDIKNSLEDQVFSDLNWEGILDLIEYRLKTIERTQLQDQVNNYNPNKGGKFSFDQDDKELRLALAKSANKHGWFKRTDHGAALAFICLKHINSFKGTRLHSIFKELNNWIENVQN